MFRCGIVLFLVSAIFCPKVNGQGSSQLIINGPYGQELKACKAEWQTISESDPRRVGDCLEKMGWAIAGKLAQPQGIPAIGLGTIEPVTVPHVMLLDTAMLSGNFTNVKVYDITKYMAPQTLRVTYDPSTQIATSVTHAKAVRGNTDYSFKVNMAGFFGMTGSLAEATAVYTRGRANFIAADTVNTLKMRMEKRPGVGLTLVNVESNTVLGNTDIEIFPAANDPVGKVLQPILKSQEVVREAGKSIAAAINNEVGWRIGAGFQRSWSNLEKI